MTGLNGLLLPRTRFLPSFLPSMTSDLFSRSTLGPSTTIRMAKCRFCILPRHLHFIILQMFLSEALLETSPATFSWVLVARPCNIPIPELVPIAMGMWVGKWDVSQTMAGNEQGKRQTGEWMIYPKKSRVLWQGGNKG